MARKKPVLAPKHGLPPTLLVPCVLQVNGDLFGGQGLGVATDIATSLLALRTPDKDSYLGLIINFPLPNSVEHTGFGKSYQLNDQKLTLSNTRKITVKFPREEIAITYRAADEQETARYPNAKKHMAWVDVVLGKDAEVFVKGFGMPYANPGHPADDWLHSPDSAPVLDEMTLLDIIQQRHFSFLVNRLDKALESKWSVASLAPKFDYGYSADHSWDMDKYMKQIDIKGHRFQATWSFDTDDSHVTVLTQSLVQDVLWIHKGCLEMATKLGSAYFVKKSASMKSTKWYAIVRMDPKFWKQYKTIWPRASEIATMKLLVHPGPNEVPESWANDLSEHWTARICQDPQNLTALNQHPLNENDLVIEAIEPVDSQLEIKEFTGREEASVAYDTNKAH
ncbi:hypothetical protein IL306_013754 [Fusarium sp. DS 682]|nr:hypothetical protein IL306_013754 [Fusarium sp. DS 682]